MTSPLLEVTGLSVEYGMPADTLFGKRRTLKAVRDIDLSVDRGQIVGVVGETGCGKSSIGRAILGLTPAAAGRIVFDGTRIDGLDARSLRQIRKTLQVVFQDPLSSLNPRMTVGDLVAEPLALHCPELAAGEVRSRAAEMLERVGLSDAMQDRYPAELSGGQAQRASIARAMVLHPRLVVCDEPVSALDVSIQAQVCNLLKALSREFGTAMIFISHDLSVVRHMCEKIVVMYLGRIIESGARDAVFGSPQHPYTRALIDAIPSADPDCADIASLATLSGELPSPLAPPSGCPFRTRCPEAIDACADEAPELTSMPNGSRVACIRRPRGAAAEHDRR